MNTQRIISQVLALAPEIPGYQIAAYMLELLEEMRSMGVRLLETIGAEDHEGYDFPIPSHVLTIFDVYVDGVKLDNTLTDEDFAKGDYSGNIYLIQGKVYTGISLTGKKVTVDGIFYDSNMTIDSLGDKWTIAFVYYVLSRYYSATDANQSNYYSDMYEIQVARVSNRRLTAPMVNIGDDL